MSSQFCLGFLLIGLVVPVFSGRLLDTVPLLTLLVIAFIVAVFCKGIFRLLCLLAFGFVVSSFHLKMIIDSQMPSDYEGQDIRATIKIRGLPTLKNERLHFDAELIGFADNSAAGQMMINKRLKLSAWPQSFSDVLDAGQVWHVTMRLKRPRGFVNPGGFDYQAWLLFHGYSATGYVRTDSEIQLIANHGPSWMEGCRLRLKKQLLRTSDSSSIGFFNALLVGDRSAIHQQQWDILVATGTAHLIAISGLHIGLIALFAFYLCRYVLTSVNTTSLYLLRFLPCSASILFSAAYAALSGFAIPAQRAWFMVFLVNLALMSGRKLSAFYVLLLVAVLVVIIDPLSLTQNGFYLSFLAVFILFFFFSHRSRKNGMINSLVLAQGVIFVGLSVVLVFRHLPISLVSPLANAIAVPVISFIVIPLLFLSAAMSFVVPNAALIILQWNDAIFDLLWSLLGKLANIDSLIFLSPAQSPGYLAIGSIGMIFFLAPRALCLRFLGVGLLLLFFFPEKESDGMVEIMTLDVGQGLSTVINTQHHTIVYDVGAKFSENFDIGSRVLAPFLRYRRVGEIDLVILSHADNDHSGGISGLDKQLKISEITANHTLPLTKNQNVCLAGKIWQFDDVSIEVIWPDTLGRIAKKENNRSCVVVVRKDDFTALFAGDIERRVEALLLKAASLPKNIDLLVAPHHGSKTSSSVEFITHLSPKAVIFSSGYKNAYGHPAPQVIKKYKDAGSQLWFTATDGGVAAYIEAGGVSTISSARQLEKRPWYSP